MFYTKSKQTDISPAALAALRNAVEKIKAYYSR
jgi:hypothetical protein